MIPFRLLGRAGPRMSGAARNAMRWLFGGGAKKIGRGLSAAESDAARAAAGAAARAVRPSPAVEVNRHIGSAVAEALDAVGLGHLKGMSGRTVRQGLRSAGPEARKIVSEAVGRDSSALQAELSRLANLRKATDDPAILQQIQNRIKYIGDRQFRLENRSPYLKQTLGNRFWRGAGTTMNLGFGGMEAYQAYDEAKKGNYANAAFHAAMAPVFGLGHVSGMAGRALRARDKVGHGGAVAKALAGFARPFERMEFAGKYGAKGSGIRRWAMRHPIIASEIAFTPLGADTMASAFVGKPGGQEQVASNQAGSGAGRPVASFRGRGLSESDVSSLSSMNDQQLMLWLLQNGFA